MCICGTALSAGLSKSSLYMHLNRYLARSWGVAKKCGISAKALGLIYSAPVTFCPSVRDMILMCLFWFNFGFVIWLFLFVLYILTCNFSIVNFLATAPWKAAFADEVIVHKEDKRKWNNAVNEHGQMWYKARWGCRKEFLCVAKRASFQYLFQAYSLRS